MRRDSCAIPLSERHHNGLAVCVLTMRSLEKDPSVENVGRLAQRLLPRDVWAELAREIGCRAVVVCLREES